MDYELIWNYKRWLLIYKKMLSGREMVFCCFVAFYISLRFSLCTWNYGWTMQPVDLVTFTSVHSISRFFELRKISSAEQKFVLIRFGNWFVRFSLWGNLIQFLIKNFDFKESVVHFDCHFSDLCLITQWNQLFWSYIDRVLNVLCRV